MTLGLVGPCSESAVMDDTICFVILDWVFDVIGSSARPTPGSNLSWLPLNATSHRHENR